VPDGTPFRSHQNNSIRERDSIRTRAEFARLCASADRRTHLETTSGLRPSIAAILREVFMPSPRWTAARRSQFLST
jgi:hypothetical protein